MIKEIVYWLLVYLPTGLHTEGMQAAGMTMSRLATFP